MRILSLLKANSDLTYEEAVVLYLLYSADKKKYINELKRYKKEFPEAFKRALNNLQKSGLITIQEDRVKVKTSAVRIRLGDNVEESTADLEEEISKWIEDYRLLFKNSNRKDSPMGHKNRVLKNMVYFFINYPEYADKDNIMKAARRYIEIQKEQGNYTRRADYFIRKTVTDNDGSLIEVSDLLTYLEQMKSGDSKVMNQYGRKIE